MSLSDFVRIELEQMAERAQVDDVLAAAEAEAAVSPESFSRIWREVRHERDAR